MKVYTFGDPASPAILLLPGTCCHWKGNFGDVIPLLSKQFYVLCVSYDGFDETEATTFPTMLAETEKIEVYITDHCGGHIRAAYGCSLGGSFVGLLVARKRIHIDYGILGSSDLDQSAPFPAWLMTTFFLPLLYSLVRDGRFRSGFLNKRLARRMEEMPEYTGAFLRMFSGARPYVSEKSCKNQCYIRRMEKRLSERAHTCRVEVALYPHGTHYVFPEGMLRMMLPLGADLFVKMAFQAAKKYPRECRETRCDIERRITEAIVQWRQI